MHLSDFNYDLPLSFIAQTPVSPRDHSKLMVLNRADHSIQDRHFFELGEFLNPGDVLVFNNSKVIPARLHTKLGYEVFLVRDLGQGNWAVLVKPGKKTPVGTKLEFEEGLVAEVLEKSPEGVFTVQFNVHGALLHNLLEIIGETPLPPYITTPVNDPKEYQTVYAKPEGSVAAPTAGFHFTEELLTKLKEQGIQQEFVTLHVGLGTFQPVKTDAIEEHKMHSEWFTLEPDVAERLNQAKVEGQRIIAVGTTACRVLESCAVDGRLQPRTGDTDIFIYPGYQFKFIDALITNFHLPKSTLLMLVSALMGREFMMEAYEHAKQAGYRFFSFGDGMFIQ